MSGDDIRADIEAAMQQGATDAPAEAVETPAAGGGGGDAAPEGESPGVGDVEPSGAEARGVPADETPAQAAQRARDEKGRFAPGRPGEKSQTPAPVAAKHPTVTVKPTLGAKPGEANATPPPAPAVVTPTEVYKAPQSWKPAAREAFAKAPPLVQAEAVRMDKEVRAVMQETAPLKRFAQEFHAVVSPFEAQIRAEGGEPLSAVRELLQTSHALRTAPAAHKAQLVANIVRTFGVDIRALDDALANGPQGGQQGQGQQQQGQGEYRDSRLDALIAQAEARRAQQAQQVAAQAQQEVAAFAEGKEFLEDVKPLMATLLADAARRKVSMSLEEAYTRACWASDEVRPYFQQREAAKAANANKASTQQARAASSSIKPQPAGVSTPSNSSGNSVLDDVLAAHRTLSNR